MLPLKKDLAKKAYDDFIEPEQTKISKSELRKFKKYKNLNDEELDVVANTFYELALSLFEMIEHPDKSIKNIKI